MDEYIIDSDIFVVKTEISDIYYTLFAVVFSFTNALALYPALSGWTRTPSFR